MLPRYLLLLATLTVSCVRGAGEQPPGYPLYSLHGSQGAPKRDQVAELVTSMPGGASFGGGSEALIKKVDGADVAVLGASFELLPGCHVVETSSRLLIADEKISWRGEIGSRALAFPMKPGHMYIVKLELLQSNSSARVHVYGIEQNAAGDEVQRFEPVMSRDEVRACMQQAAALAPDYDTPEPRAGG